MKSSLFCILLFVLITPALTRSEMVPNKGKYDARVRIVNYNPENVIKILTFYGVSTHIQFGDGEDVKYFAAGDDKAWRIVSKENNLFIKPTSEKADTNVTVITKKRTYQFALVVDKKSIRDEKAWSSQNLIYSLSFRYPQEEAAKTLEEEKRAKEKAAYLEIQAKLKAKKYDEKANFNYWVAGSEEISPTTAYDNGSFIFLTFSNNRDMPAIYSVDENEKEALINTNVINGNTIVVQRMVKKLMLRKGPSVAAVVNRSFDLDGGKDNKTGTVAPDVERIIKGEQNEL